MTALVLTRQLPTASVLLQLTGMPAGAFSITRTDANGATPVRLRTGQAPIAGVLTLTDYEPALTGVVRYDVVDSANVTTTQSTTFDGQATVPQINGVQLPGQRVAPELVTGYDSSREASSSVHWIVDRDDPVVVLGATRTRTGRLVVWCRNHADAKATQDVLALSRILMLRQPTHPGMDMYFLASEATTEPLRSTSEGWRWQASAQYVEVRSPSLPLLGAAGWTYDDLPGLYPSYTALRGAFATYADLTVGP